MCAYIFSSQAKMHSESSLVNSNDIDIDGRRTDTSNGHNSSSEPNLLTLESAKKEPVIVSNIVHINDNVVNLESGKKGRNEDKSSLNVQGEIDTLDKSDETLAGNGNGSDSTSTRVRIQVRVESHSSDQDDEVITSIRRQFYDDTSETNLNGELMND